MLKLNKILSLAILFLLTILVVGCSSSTSTSEENKPKSSANKVQDVLEKALNTWDNNSKNKIFAWTSKQNQVYPFQDGTYNVVKTNEALEERYDKSHIHVTSSNKSGFEINKEPSNLQQGESWDQWKNGENRTYSKFTDPSSDESEKEGTWMKQDQYTGQLYVSSLPVEFLNAIKDSKTTNGVTITETADTYKIVAKPEFYASLPNFLSEMEKKTKFPVYPKAVTYTINRGNGTMMDYNVQKTKAKSVDCSVVIDKKTSLITEVNLHVQLELAVSSGKPPTSDQVITMKKTGELQKPFQVPADVIKEKGK